MQNLGRARPLYILLSIYKLKLDWSTVPCPRPETIVSSAGLEAPAILLPLSPSVSGYSRVQDIPNYLCGCSELGSSWLQAGECSHCGAVSSVRASSFLQQRVAECSRLLLCVTLPLPFSFLDGVLWDQWRICENCASSSSTSQNQESAAPSVGLLPMMQQ